MPGLRSRSQVSKVLWLALLLVLVAAALFKPALARMYVIEHDRPHHEGGHGARAEPAFGRRGRQSRKRIRRAGPLAKGARGSCR